jgi:hypothetical protein
MTMSALHKKTKETKKKKKKREARDPHGVYVGVYVVVVWHLRGVYVSMVVVVEMGFANLPELEFSSNTNNQSKCGKHLHNTPPASTGSEFYAQKKEMQRNVLESRSNNPCCVV